jgi:hypothetical protein
MVSGQYHLDQIKVMNFMMILTEEDGILVIGLMIQVYIPCNILFVKYLLLLIFAQLLDQQLLIIDSLIATNGLFNSRDFAHRLSKWINKGYPELNNKPPFGIGKKSFLIS